MHWDFRLEIAGVLASWAVPKGPSLNPADKRLAVQTEDHPLDYANFEGVIPEGNYGAGPVMVWDNGRYEVEGDAPAAEQLARGEIKFRLHGHKLRGSFVLVHTGKRTADPKARKNWLLIKHHDATATTDWNVSKYDWSVLSGRSLQEIAQGLPARAVSAGSLPGARRSAMPNDIAPMLATLIDKPFSDPGWLFELKWDGMRVLASVSGGSCELRSRRGRAVTSQFPELERLPSLLSAKEAIVDGEAVVLDEEGRPDFGRMQERMNVADPTASLVAQNPIVYYIFDIPYCDGYDLRDVALIERKRFLQHIILPEDPVRYSDHVVEQGRELYELSKQRGLEGMIGKRIDGKYASARSREWVKLKTTNEVDAVVGGFTAPRGGREHFGALLLGLYEGEKLRFIGGCGTGFNESTQADVSGRLQGMVSGRAPFADKPDTREKATWVTPELVARVKFSEWTRDKHLRAPVFLALRTDIDPKACRLELEEPSDVPVHSGGGSESNATSQKRGARASKRGAGSSAGNMATRPNSAGIADSGDGARVETELRDANSDTLNVKVNDRPLRLTHLSKVYFPDPNLTKRDLLLHYVRVAGLILPFLRNRPLVLRRMPEGLKGKLFYQKDASAARGIPDWMPSVTIYSEESRKEVRYAMANDLASLLFLTNLGCIDHDPWSSRVD